MRKIVEFLSRFACSCGDVKAQTQLLIKERKNRQNDRKSSESSKLEEIQEFLTKNEDISTYKVH